MLLTLLGSLTIAGSLLLDVPYVPQTDALCGGAAMAMVYRYWGDTHAGVKQFASLVDRRAGGIAEEVLVDAVKQRGWTAVRFDGSMERLQSHLAARAPVIVLLADHRDRYHYVVVIGMTSDHVVIHDPSWGPSRSVGIADFDRLWKTSNHWSLLVLPPPTPINADSGHDETAPASSETPARTSRCDLLLAGALASIEQTGLFSADEILDSVRAECPQSAGPIRELAGVRFEQRRWSDAASLARRAIGLDQNDSYAWDLLGSSLFMQDDPVGALRAWNRIGRPRLSTIRIAGLHRTRYQLVADVLRLEPGEVLTAATFERSRRLLNELPDRADARMALRPEPDGFASVDVVLHERATRPSGLAQWAAAPLRAGIDREVMITIPGVSGQGELWTASWRWWSDRPQVAVSFTAPRRGRIPGVWRVDGGWEAQTYAIGGIAAPLVRESRLHGGLSVNEWLTNRIRYSFSGGIDSWSRRRRDASIGASLESRFIQDRLSLVGDAITWMPLSGDRGFSSLAARVQFRPAPPAARSNFLTVAGIERVSDAAPLAIWRGAGEGRARDVLLRAHPLLAGGIIDTGTRSSFGRTLQFASAEAQRWLDRPRLLRIGIALFGDMARTSRSLSGESTFHVDVGTGVRIRLPAAQSALRIDVAHGLRDGGNALTFGWSCY